MRAIQRAVVTGVTGLVGGAVARRLAVQGCQTLALVRPEADRRRFSTLHDVSLLEWDGIFTDSFAAQLRDFRPDVVFHAAAYGVQPGEADVERMLRSNVDYTVALMRAAAAIPNCRFIHTGSCFEYGAPTYGVNIAESCPAVPFSPYGATKVAATHLVSTLAPQLKLPSLILRPFAVYGPGEGPRRLLPSLVGALTRNEPLDLTPGEQMRDWLHVDDVAEAYLCATTIETNPGKVSIFNICSATSTSVRSFGEAVARAMGVSGDALHWGRRPYRAEEPMWIVGDNARFQQATGWRPELSLQKGLQLSLNSASLAA